jgi:acyl-CoA reductase-like NAD-dependent aldehyde dehydrogenase
LTPRYYNNTMTMDASKIETRLFINNEFVNSSSGKTFDVVNPATEEVLCAVQEASEDDVEKAVRLIDACMRACEP